MFQTVLAVIAVFVFLLYTWGNRHQQLFKMGVAAIVAVIATILYFYMNEPVVLKGPDKLSEDLRRLLMSGENSDMIIMVSGKRFPVHKAILGARSPVFKQEILEWKSTSHEIHIDDCDPDTFLLFLQYVYTEKLSGVTPGNSISLYEVAKKYQVDTLREDCLQYITKSLSVNTFCDSIIFASKHHEKKLVDTAKDFFSYKMSEIVRTIQWKEFLSDHPTTANALIISATSVKN